MPGDLCRRNVAGLSFLKSSLREGTSAECHWVLISREIGKVEASSHFGGYGVYQELASVRGLGNQQLPGYQFDQNEKHDHANCDRDEQNNPSGLVESKREPIHGCR
jgi:hypothetical protein